MHDSSTFYPRPCLPEKSRKRKQQKILIPIKIVMSRGVNDLCFIFQTQFKMTHKQKRSKRFNLDCAIHIYNILVLFLLLYIHLLSRFRWQNWWVESIKHGGKKKKSYSFQQKYINIKSFIWKKHCVIYCDNKVPTATKIYYYMFIHHQV